MTVLHIKDWCPTCRQEIESDSKAFRLFCRCPYCITALDPLVVNYAGKPVTLDNPEFEAAQWSLFEDQPELHAMFLRARHSCAPIEVDWHRVGRIQFLPEYRAVTGSWKDREVPFTLGRVFEHGYEDFCLASGSNAAIAFAFAAVHLGIGKNAHIFVPKHAEQRVVKVLEELGVERFMIDLHVVDGDSDMAGKAAHYWANTKEHPLCSGWAHWGRRLGLAFMWYDYPTMRPDWYFQGVAGALGMWGYDFYNVHRWNMKLGPPVYCQPDVCAPFAHAWLERGVPDKVLGRPKPIEGPVVDSVAPVLNARDVQQQLLFFYSQAPCVAVPTRKRIVSAMHDLWDFGFEDAGLEAATALAGLELFHSKYPKLLEGKENVVNLSGRWRPGDEKVRP